MYSSEYQDLLKRLNELQDWLLKNTPTVKELNDIRNQLMNAVVQLQSVINVINAKVSMMEKKQNAFELIEQQDGLYIKSTATGKVYKVQPAE